MSLHRLPVELPRYRPEIDGLRALWHSPTAAFYLFPPRAWELLMGSLLAVKAVPSLKHRVLREAVGLSGIGLIAASVFLYNRSTPFPGLYALAPCLGAWLIMYAGEACLIGWWERSPTGKLLLHLAALTRPRHPFPCFSQHGSQIVRRFPGRAAGGTPPTVQHGSPNGILW